MPDVEWIRETGNCIEDVLRHLPPPESANGHDRDDDGGVWHTDEDPAPEFDRERRPKKPDVSSALPFVDFDDLQVEVQKPWLLKNVIALAETSSWIGGPGKGKSA